MHIIHGVNGKHSGAEWKYRPRWIEPELARSVADHRVVVLTGARQVGKSTLLEHAPATADWRTHSLDDPDVLRQAEREPEALWAGTTRVVIDEAQRAPALLLAVKRAVDRDRKKRFVLSGSANFELLRSVGESLAGRAVYLVLRPMALGEIQSRGAPELMRDLLSGRLPAEGGAQGALDPLPLILRGFMPELPSLSSPEAVLSWWRGYVGTYMERDLRNLSQVSALTDYRRVMELAALRTGQLANQTEIARDAAVSQPTVHRYLNLLETSYLLARLPAFAAGKTARLVKSPKLFWADPALAAFLMGHYSLDGLRDAREIGALFECLVFHHLQVANDLLLPPGRLYHWGSQAGISVDFVLEWGRSLLAIEVKLSQTARYDDVRGLERCLASHPACRAGLLVYAGNEIVRLGEKIVAVPWTAIAR